MGLITAREAAERLGIDRRRVYVLIRQERLPARKLGRDWVIEEDDLTLVEKTDEGFHRPRGTLLVTEAAERLGVTPSRVHQLMREGRLEARREGNLWLLDAEAVRALRQQREAE